MWNVILYNFGWNFLPNVGMYAIYCDYFLNIFWPTFWMLDVTDVVVTFCLKPMGVFLADVICHIIMSWLMFVAIVADVNATLFVCGRENHIE